MTCGLCPRKCGADRKNIKGPCLGGDEMRVGAILVHRGEEPPLIHGAGSGAVFFSGCPLQCPYCQNRQVSHLGLGCDIKPKQLSSYMLELQLMGCSNINLVTPTHYAYKLALCLEEARKNGLVIPVMLNSSGYETIETLEMLMPYLDIFLMDIRYGDEESGRKLGDVKGYWENAMDVTEYLFRHAGPLKTDADGQAVSGLMIRHLVLPGLASKPFAVLDYLACLSLKIPISLMAQYNPAFYSGDIELLKRGITKDEYGAVLDHALELGFETIFSQEIDSKDTYKPDFYKLYPFSDCVNLLVKDGYSLDALIKR
jgi:putative pyruvate formate lyase activating enzyme